MASITLAKPGTVTNNMAGAISTASGAGVFVMKLAHAQLGFTVNVASTTGDGDEFPVVESNEMLDGRCIFQGWMTAADVINIANLTASTNPTAPATFSTVLTLASSRTITMTIIVESVSIDWEADAPYVGATLVTHRTLAQGESTDNFAEA